MTETATCFIIKADKLILKNIIVLKTPVSRAFFNVDVMMIGIREYGAKWAALFAEME